MGAVFFTDEGHGRSLPEAYREACRSAEAEYGGTSYNGTISTTSGVRVLPMTTMKGLTTEERLAVLEALADGMEQPQLSTRAAKAFEALKGGYKAEKRGKCFAVELNKPKGSPLPRGSRLFAFAGIAAE